MHVEIYNVTWVNGTKKFLRVHVLQIQEEETLIEYPAHASYVNIESLRGEHVYTKAEFDSMFMVKHDKYPKMSCYEYQKMLEDKFNIHHNEKVV